MELLDRFLKYVAYDTQSDEASETFPSTDKQKVLLTALKEEMEALGMTEVTMDKYGYVMGTIPASAGCETAPVIGFIALAIMSRPIKSGRISNTQKYGFIRKKRPKRNKRYFIVYSSSPSVRPQHFLYFLPLPQGQGSLRPTFSFFL